VSSSTPGLGARAASPPRASEAMTLVLGMTPWNSGRVSSSFASSTGRTATMNSASAKAPPAGAASIASAPRRGGA